MLLPSVVQHEPSAGRIHTCTQAKRWSGRHCPANKRGSERLSPAQAPPQLFLPPVLLVCCVASLWGAHLASDSSAAMGQAHRVASEGEARALKARATSVGGGAARQEATEHSGQEKSEPWSRGGPGASAGKGPS